MVYIDRLKDLKTKRQTAKSEMNIIRGHIAATEISAVKRQHTIKVEFEHEVQRAIQEIAKVKYSNAERRKVELDKLKNSDLKLNEILGALENYKKLEQCLLRDDEAYKIEERYLFKEIELFITLKNFDSSSIRAGA